jgi:hypothetical protein
MKGTEVKRLGMEDEDNEDIFPRRISTRFCKDPALAYIKFHLPGETERFADDLRIVHTEVEIRT